MAALVATVSMFESALAFNSVVNIGNASKLTSTSTMFQGATSFNQPVNLYVVTKLADMSSMFRGASSFNQPLVIESGLIKWLSYMFAEAVAFDSSISFTSTPTLLMCTAMFQNAISFNRSLTLPSVDDTTYMFFNASKFNAPLILDTAAVNSMRSMFELAKIDNDDNTKHRSTIMHNGKKYRQIWAYKMANVEGDIMPFNNSRTWSPNKFDMDKVEYNNAYIRWKTLINIIRTDNEIKQFLENDALAEYFQIDCIIVKNAVEIDNNGDLFNPLEGKLFSEHATKAIYNKDISYDLNKQAQNFAEMFGITLNKYTIDNYKLNSCFLNLIVDTWRSAFEKRKTDGKRMYAELTYESVCQIINLTYKNQDIGLSLNESKAFFEKFRLGIDVVNVYGEIIFAYRPTRGLNPLIFPSILRVLMHNNHLYKLDKDCKSRLDKLRQKAKQANIEQKLNEDDITTLFVSNKYKLRTPVLDGCEVHFINNLNDCVELVKQCKTEKIKFITNNNLTTLLFEMIDYDYTPSIGFGGMNLLSLGFKVGKMYASIENSEHSTRRHNYAFGRKGTL